MQSAETNQLYHLRWAYSKKEGRQSVCLLLIGQLATQRELWLSAAIFLVLFICFSGAVVFNVFDPCTLFHQMSECHSYFPILSDAKHAFQTTWHFMH